MTTKVSNSEHGQISHAEVPGLLTIKPERGISQGCRRGESLSQRRYAASPLVTNPCHPHPPDSATDRAPRGGSAFNVRSSMLVPSIFHRPGPGTASAGAPADSDQQTTMCVPADPPFSVKHFGHRNMTPCASALSSTQRQPFSVERINRASRSTSLVKPSCPAARPACRPATCLGHR